MKKTLAISLFLAVLGSSAYSQTSPIGPAPTPLPRQSISAKLAENLLRADNVGITREAKGKAYAKLLEGQRYLWQSSPLRTQDGNPSYARMAKQAFLEAVELNPRLAEGYTALAELTISMPPGDVDEAINLARMAIKIKPDNFGSHRIIARLFTFKSHLKNGTLDIGNANHAVAAWEEVTRLDPRNAEAWAFLSEYYGEMGKSAERIEALRKWISSATPLETQFYRRVIGGSENLSTESASLKLGTALLDTGKSVEAVEVLSLLLADQPENAQAAELLREAIESVDVKGAETAIEAIRPAVYANPGNVSLANLLARAHVKAGRSSDAIKLMSIHSANLTLTDPSQAANLQVALGDLFLEADRGAEAVKAYEEALKLRGVERAKTVDDDEREFVMAVFEKIIRTYRNENRSVEVKAAIEKVRRLLGDNDLFADRQLIALYRDSGMKQEALEAVRAVRSRSPDDYGLLRLEASTLTDLGRVDEGVALVKKLVPAPATTPTTVSQLMFDDFSNYLFISQLWNQAGRSKEAIEAANLAFNAAKGNERKQIAKLTLASAQHTSGDSASAEATLREILKQSPGNPVALNNLGYFLLDRHEKVAEALELIQRAVRIDPTNPSYLDSLGWGYFRMGKLDEAEKYLKEASKIDSGSATIHDHLGDVYFKQGKKELAIAAWRKALQLEADPAIVAKIRKKLETAK